MKNKNVIILSIDEVRPDHLSCYGYNKIKTKNIDSIAKEGVLFKRCITASDLTPICMSSVMCAKYPNKHGMRDPYSKIQAKTFAEVLKEKGFKTAGFVGNGLLGAEHGFGRGFDYFDQPTKDTSWKRGQYPDKKGVFYEGNWWIDKMFEWLDNNKDFQFFIWGHFYETHEGSQHSLLKRGLLEEGRLPEFGYYDAKIEMVDKVLFGPLIKKLKEFGIYENTIFVAMSDHGTCLGEHPREPLPWRGGNVVYPQHTDMHDTDITSFLIMKDKDLPKNKKIEGMVRTVDIVPTLLELLEINVSEDFDGQSLMSFIEQGKASGLTAYSEDLFEVRGPGAVQGIRTDTYKYMRNLSRWTEEFYDLKEDPGEQNNIVANAENKDIIKKSRVIMNEKLWKVQATYGGSFSKEKEEEIKQRLRALGYIQ
ncbi:hypothetical protein DRN58_01580 [Thermococci archaeon]|nr:MAG: hypothetical protein DRN58_01580 [Thermococci archaeon]